MIPKTEENRFYLIDTIRGIAIINMILYHLFYDLVYIYGLNLTWFKTEEAFIWEQFICWTFIIISGITQNFNHHPYKEALIVSLSGLLVTIVTVLFDSNIAIYFGILTFLGAAVFILTILKKFLNRLNIYWALASFFLLFLLFRNINLGYLGFGKIDLLKLPDFLYPIEPGWLQTFIGFTAINFYSSDYFSLLPWLFLFISGYFLFQVIKETKFINIVKTKGNSFLAFLGRHSLLIYLLHQIVIMLVLMIIF